MSAVNRSLVWVGVATLAVLAAGVLGWVSLSRVQSDDQPDDLRKVHYAPQVQGKGNSEDGRISVTTVHPTLSTVERVVVQPGSVHAYEVVQVFAKASGFLKSLNVDIGDPVKAGSVVAVVDIPETDKAVIRAKAVVRQSESKVKQMKSRLDSARADEMAAKALVDQAEANSKSAAAWVRFRSKQLGRMKELFSLKSIDERLVDESLERHEAAVETERAAIAAIATSRAQALAKAAKIREIEADVEEASSAVAVSQAELERSVIQQDFATLRAPFDGVVTHRTLVPGDYVRAANESGSQPFLSIQRVDRMRVTVQIPDRDVPFADPGDSAEVQLDAFPGEVFRAKISRVAASEDPQTRLMPIEIDLPNPQGAIRQGMYGRVRLVLAKTSDQISIPSACLAGRAQAGKANVYVVVEHIATLRPIRIGPDDGLRVAVLEGLNVADEVVVRPPASLQYQSPVRATLEPIKKVAESR